jgi:hypothetical protein
LGYPWCFQPGRSADADRRHPRAIDEPSIWRLRGQSRIIDSDGSLLSQLAEQEGVLTAAATMDPGRKHYRPQPSYGGWLQPGPVLARKVIIPRDILTGTLTYATSRERRRKARANALRVQRTQRAESPRPAAGTR